MFDSTFGLTFDRSHTDNSYTLYVRGGRDMRAATSVKVTYRDGTSETFTPTQLGNGQAKIPHPKTETIVGMAMVFKRD